MVPLFFCEFANSINEGERETASGEVGDKASACLKSGNFNCRTMWCSLATCHSGTCFWRAANSCPLSGGTPPRQGTQVFDASEAMKSPYTQDGLSGELDAMSGRD